MRKYIFIFLICLTGVNTRAESLVLTQALQVLKLSIAEAQLEKPVCLRGIVISGHELEIGEEAVICDDSGSLFIQANTSLAGLLSRSNLVEVTGVTSSGTFAPIAIVNKVRVFGKSEIPSPKRVVYDELLSGHLDSQWLEVVGCLRSCIYLTNALPNGDGGTEAELAMGGGRLVVQFLGHGVTPDMVGDTLRIRGICFHRFNLKHQFYQTYLIVPEGESAVVDQLPNPKPFDLPVQSIGSLLQFAQQGSFGNRVQVHGVVTYQHPGMFLYVQDGQQGLFVRTLQDTIAPIGCEVCVVGFPAQGDYSPIIEDAIFQIKSDSKMPPAPIPVQHPNDAFDHDAELISGRAKIIGYLQQDDGWVLSMQMDNSVFTAFLLNSPNMKNYRPQFMVDSEVEFTGVCSVVMGSLMPRNPLQAPQSFRVLLRSENDLSLIKPPPWWTPQRIWVVTAIVTLALVSCIAAVILFARVRLARQSMDRRQAEAEFTAILKERNRLAREIHDTLAQDISGICAQLEVARKRISPGNEVALLHLNLAQAAARSSLQEARRTIWNMRSQVLEGRDLGVALSELLDQEARSANINPRSVIKGKVRSLPSALENDLLRIGQEAIHNAIRHGQPANLILELTFSDEMVILVVRDDGCGFDQKKAYLNSSTRFGLKGIQERAIQNGGRLTIHSEAGKGTQICLKVPLI